MKDDPQPVVLITGAAGGIGGATARVFADAGWCVVGVDRKAIEPPAWMAHFIQADIAEPDAADRIIDAMQARTGRLDALVNNAAVQLCKSLVETTAAEWDAVQAANVRSVFLTARAAFALLRESEGAIINVSSVHALATSSCIAAYAASKGALLALTRAMALEFGPYNIRVNTVLPGAVDTSMLHDGLSRGHVGGLSLDEMVRGLGQKHVMGRVGRPEEIGQAILFLADRARSSFMTGQAMVVDGGATARLSTE